MTVKLSIQQIQKRFGDVRAVQDISFEVNCGEVVGLLGANGAGKTTTMRMIAGFISPDSGRILIDGVDIQQDLLGSRQKIGYLPENCPLYLDLEVTEALGYFAKLRGVPSRQIQRCVKEMVDVCGLRDVVGRTIGEFSKGYRQRVGLAQALIHRPQILILDEPTTGLDPNQIIHIRELIRELGIDTTIILSTHILQEVDAMCSKAFIINQGRMVASGSLAELQQTKAGKASYHLTVKAPESELRDRLSRLPHATIVQCHPANGSGWLRVVLASGQGGDCAEEMFQWVVTNQWSLKELRRENASLEEVFRSITQ